MPQTQKNDNANTKPISRLVDFAPGQPDDFDCEWKRLRLAPWKYPNSKSGKYMTFLLVDIEPDPDSGFEPFTAPYTFGFLNRTMPSNDGETPLIDEDRAKELAEGNDSLDQSEIEQFEGTTFCGSKPAPFLDWPELADSIQTCGMSYDEFPEGDFSGFEGMKCHMNRLPAKNQSQKKSAGAGDSAQATEWKVLKVTEIHAKPGEKSSKGKASTSKATTKVNGSTSGNGASDLESRVRDVLVEALRSGAIKLDEKTGTVNKKSPILRGKVTTQGKFNKDGMLKPTMAILDTDTFHEASAEMGLYLYDAETGEITPLEAEE